MELREGYKMTEVGIIPEDWNLTSLSKITTQIGDGIHTTPNYDDNGEYYFINGNNLVNGKIYLDENTKRISSKEFKNHSRELNHQTILLSINGTIGNIAFFNSEPVILGKSAAYLNSSTKIRREFLFYVLQTKPIQIYFENELTGSTIKNLGLTSIRRTPVPLPTLLEQAAIATALCDMDALISQTEKLIEKKKAIKQGMMQQLLSPYDAKGKLKKGWNKKKLGEIGESLIGLTYKPENVVNHGTLVLRSSNIEENKLKLEDLVFVNLEIDKKIITKYGDILICVRNGSRNLIGKCAYIDETVVGQTFGAFMTVFRSELNDYVFYAFQSKELKSQIEENLGATINQITNGSLNSFEITIPPAEERFEIVNVLNEIVSEIDTLEKKLKKFMNIKQSMMQSLLTGKIRIYNPEHEPSIQV